MGSKGTGDGQFILPIGSDFDSHTDHGIDRSASRVQEFSSNGRFIAQTLISKVDVEKALILEDIEFDKFDKEYLTDRGNHNIMSYSQGVTNYFFI